MKALRQDFTRVTIPTSLNSAFVCILCSLPRTYSESDWRSVLLFANCSLASPSRLLRGVLLSYMSSCVSAWGCSQQHARVLLFLLSQKHRKGNETKLPSRLIYLHPLFRSASRQLFALMISTIFGYSLCLRNQFQVCFPLH